MGKLLLIFRTIHCSHVHVDEIDSVRVEFYIITCIFSFFFFSFSLLSSFVYCANVYDLLYFLIFRNIREEESYRELQCKYVKRQDSDLWPVTTLNKVLKSRPSITHRFLSTVRGFPALSPPRKNPTRWILMQFALVPWKTSSTLSPTCRASREFRA